MLKKFSLPVDHVGILAGDIAKCSSVFFRLGFTADAGRVSFEGIPVESRPKVARFIFDNAYFECATANPDEYPCVKEGHFAHELVLTTLSAQKVAADAAKYGQTVGDIVHAKRDADHGELKGTAMFEFVLVRDTPLRDTMFGLVEHKTRELIMQDSKYAHQNGTKRLGEIVITCDDPAILDWMERNMPKIHALVGPSDTELLDIWVMSAAEASEKVGVALPAGKVDYSVFTFEAADLEAVRGVLQAGGFAFAQKDERLVVDLTRELGKAIVFKQL